MTIGALRASARGGGGGRLLVRAVSSRAGAKETLSRADASPMQRALPIMFAPSELARFSELLSFRDRRLDGTVVGERSATNVYGSTVTLHNTEAAPYFPAADARLQALLIGSQGSHQEADFGQEMSYVTPLAPAQIRALQRYVISIKRVAQMKGKGRVHGYYAMIVVGNGKGLVGYGEGRDENLDRACNKAHQRAVKNMDMVNVHRSKSGSNTVETSVEGHWGSSRVVIRPRPAGFGLRVPDVLHPVARAAGFTDLSAAVYGSSNNMNVVKAAMRVLWGGSAPMRMGGIVEGSLGRDHRGQGARSRRDMELSRGRRLEEFDV